MSSVGSQRGKVFARVGEALLAIANRGGRQGNCTLGAGHERLEALLPEPGGERGLVWREGWGWVSRPIDVETAEEAGEVEAA